MISSHVPVLIPLTFLGFALLIALVGLWKEHLTHVLAVGGAAVATGLSTFGFYNLLAGGEHIRYHFGGWDPPIGIEFLYDELSAFLVLVINAIAFLVLLHSLRIGEREFPGKRTGYYSVSMLLMLGFNGMVLTGDLFNLFVFLEISSLASYGLIAVGERRAPFSAFRYLLIGTIGGSLYLLGVGFLYTVTGTLNILDMSQMLPMVIDNAAVPTGLALVLVGIGIKAALFPLHGWLPDAYTYASSTSSALIAPIGTKVAAYVLLRVLLFLFGVGLIGDLLPVSEIIAVLAAAGILYGSIMAIAQSELKKMLAYSSISQIGYIFLGISLVNFYGLVGAVLHILNHALMKSCLFLVSGNLRSEGEETRIPGFTSRYAEQYPWSMAAFSTAALSMVGLPPLAGFFSKWYLALGTIQNGSWILLAVILTSSLLNAAYFFRVLENLYLRDEDAQAEGPENEPQEEDYGTIGGTMLLPTSATAIGIVVVGIFNVYIVEAIARMLPAGM